MLDAYTDGTHIKSITGWQLTTYTYHTIEADVFADYSGEGDNIHETETIRDELLKIAYGV